MELQAAKRQDANKKPQRDEPRSISFALIGLAACLVVACCLACFLPSNVGKTAPSDGLRSVTDLPAGLVDMEYAVRGRVVVKAGELKQRLAAGEKLPFTELVFCNIGNPHAVRQPPINFYREVASALYHPRLLDANFPETSGFASDVVDRARAYHAATGFAGVGAYTDSIGLELVRKQVADFIHARDGYPCEPTHLALTTGASEGVKRVLGALVRGPSDGVLIPSPQYPLYSATLTMLGGTAVYYELDEAANWTVSLAALERSVAEAKAAGVGLRALCLINPGNPVGAVLGADELALILSFAALHGLVVLADEVYQANVYADGLAFHSCKKVLRDLQGGVRAVPSGLDASAVAAKLGAAQLISFHSTSKGLLGECGERGGYLEFVGFSQEVIDVFTKVAASSLSSGTIGQIFVGLMVTPPQPTEPSYPAFHEESSRIFAGLRRRAHLASTELNAIDGLSSAPIQGAMYAFPSVRLPAAFVQHARDEGVPPDELWCLQLLEQTGIVTVPGSGFGQKPGTFHFRMTILPADEVFDGMLGRLGAFQRAFYERWDPQAA